MFPDYDDSPLKDGTLHAAMTVPAFDQDVGRAIIDGAVVIYALGHEPAWLSVLLAIRDAEDAA